MESEMENLLCYIKFDCVRSDRQDGEETEAARTEASYVLCPMSWLAGLSKLSQHCGAVSAIVIMTARMRK